MRGGKLRIRVKMNKNAAILYVILTLFTLFAGLFILRKITNTNDPKSLKSQFEQLNDVMNEDFEISR